MYHFIVCRFLRDSGIRLGEVTRAVFVVALPWAKAGAGSQELVPTGLYSFILQVFESYLDVCAPSHDLIARWIKIESDDLLNTKYDF